MELLVTVGLLTEGELLGQGDGLRAALERLKLPASVEPLATIELQAEDDIP